MSSYSSVNRVNANSGEKSTVVDSKLSEQIKFKQAIGKEIIMGRPNMQAQRREQILDAYERCVVRFGVEGATLQKVSEEAGLARALIRHNVGNKDELLEALTERFFKQSESYVEELEKMLPKQARASSLIEWLFDPEHHDVTLVRICEALIQAATEKPALQAQVTEWLERFVELVADCLRSQFPKSKKTDIGIVATGIVTIYCSFDSFYCLPANHDIRTHSKSAAIRLMDSLAY